MALWKPFRGNRTDLDVVEKHDGYVYFCIDDGALFFDYADADGNLQRKQISAKDAETLGMHTADEFLLKEDFESLTITDVADFGLIETTSAKEVIVDIADYSGMTDKSEYNISSSVEYLRFETIIDNSSNIHWTFNGHKNCVIDNVRFNWDSIRIVNLNNFKEVRNCTPDEHSYFQWYNLVSINNCDKITECGAHRVIDCKEIYNSKIFSGATSVVKNAHIVKNIEYLRRDSDQSDEDEGLYDYTIKDCFYVENCPDAIYENCTIVKHADGTIISDIGKVEIEALRTDTATQDAVVLYEAQAYTDDALAQAKASGEFGGGSAIIDVGELPTININKGAIYRLITAKFISNYYVYVDSWKCYCVNSLPEIGEPTTTDMVNITSYYNVSDNEVYGYVDSNLSASGGIPVGWYPIDTLGQAFNVNWGGVITDDEDIDDSAKVLLSQDYYIYQDGWCKVPFAYEKQQPFVIQWDGVVGDRFALDVSALGYPNSFFVKMTDRVFANEELIGCSYTQSSGYEHTIEEDDLVNMFAGMTSVDNGIVIVHDAELLNEALGTPSGYMTNGTYFALVVDDNGNAVNYTNRFITSAKTTKIIKIDAKYLDIPEINVDLSDYVTNSEIPSMINDALAQQIVQSTGISKKSVMSQKAVTDIYEGLFGSLYKNYLDPSKKKIGMLNTTGLIHTGGSYDNYYYFEEYIPVVEGDVISIQSTYYNKRYSSVGAEHQGYINVARYIAYDESKNPLQNLGYVMSTTDGIKGRYYIVPAGVAFVSLSMAKSTYELEGITDIAIVKNISEVMPFIEYGKSIPLKFKSDYLPESSGDNSSILAFIPDKIVCAVGRTIEIYNSQIMPNADKYHFRWNCSVGKALRRKFSITGTESLIGEYPLALTIYNDDLTVVYSKSVTLKIVADNITAAKTICPIGDSLTNCKYWLWEVSKLNSNINYVGTRSGRVYDVKSNPVAYTDINHEGRSGWNSSFYLSAKEYSYESEGLHPFWDSTNSKFSWGYYKSHTGISPNAVQIFLGTNDLTGGMSPEQFAENIKTMVDDIRSSDSSIPIFIVLTLCWGNQNGIGNQTSSDGFASQKGRFKYDEDVKTITGVKALYETLKDYSNLHFVPITQCHDSEYNFGGTETPVNPRASQTEMIPSEAVHPQQQGYEQMADIMYSVYCEAFSS